MVTTLSKNRYIKRMVLYKQIQNTSYSFRVQRKMKIFYRVQNMYVYRHTKSQFRKIVLTASVFRVF